MSRLTLLSRSISGQVAVVTGAASGMGRATAHLLADEGAVVAVLDRTPGGAEAVAQEIVDHGGRAVAIDVDLADAAATAEAMASARDALGPIDLLVNNAGLSRPAPIDQEDFKKWAQGLADAGAAAYKAAQSKNMDAMVEVSGTVADACAACHEKYRDKDDTKDRCIP